MGDCDSCGKNIPSEEGVIVGDLLLCRKCRPKYSGVAKAYSPNINDARRKSSSTKYPRTAFGLQVKPVFGIE